MDLLRKHLFFVLMASGVPGADCYMQSAENLSKEMQRFTYRLGVYAQCLRGKATQEKRKAAQKAIVKDGVLIMSSLAALAGGSVVLMKYGPQFLRNSEVQSDTEKTDEDKDTVAGEQSKDTQEPMSITVPDIDLVKTSVPDVAQKIIDAPVNTVIECSNIGISFECAKVTKKANFKIDIEIPLTSMEIHWLRDPNLLYGKYEHISNLIDHLVLAKKNNPIEEIELKISYGENNQFLASYTKLRGIWKSDSMRIIGGEILPYESSFSNNK